MQQFIAAIDQGTTSTRCIIFNHEGKIICSEQQEHHQYFPQPGWVEHDANEIWHRTQNVLAKAIGKSGAQSRDIAAVGITNQRETTLVWDRYNGEPVHPAIVWQDTRTSQICNALAANGGQDRYRKTTGLPLATYFAGPKIQWILDSDATLRKRAESGDLLFGTMDSWLLWKLTGGVKGGLHMTDVTNASRTLCMNLATLDWDDNILADLNLPRLMLPSIQSSSQIYGEIKEGDLRGVPIAGILGDQQAALFGQTCYSVGEAKNTYGTGCFMLLNTGSEIVLSRNGLLTTVAYKIGDQPAIYALEGSIAIAGALVQWLRDNLGIITRSADIEPLARSVADNGGIFFVPAFSGLFAPYWRSDARAIIAGMTQYTNKGHIARAVLEATAFQVLEVLDAMNKDSGVDLRALKVDGGMVVNDLLMQFQADLLNVPVIRPSVSETTALGAAYAAGLAVGFWTEIEDLRANWKEDKRWVSTMEEGKRRKLYAGWKKAVKSTFNWVDS
ncbi:MAG: glycerol kinase [Chloroflexi bacterium 44-23]|nr:MAG: glycerol kinase [Chloroflexi bacterium 44-23]